jgi:hypothetical protein
MVGSYGAACVNNVLVLQQTGRRQMGRRVTLSLSASPVRRRGEVEEANA